MKFVLFQLCTLVKKVRPSGQSPSAKTLLKKKSIERRVLSRQTVNRKFLQGWTIIQFLLFDFVYLTNRVQWHDRKPKRKQVKITIIGENSLSFCFIFLKLSYKAQLQFR